MTATLARLVTSPQSILADLLIDKCVVTWGELIQNQDIEGQMIWTEYFRLGLIGWF